MSYAPYRRPPLSPELLLGFPLWAVPRAALDFVLADAMRHVERQYPRLSQRLAALDGIRVLIDPTDLPIGFDLHVTEGKATLRVASERPGDGAVAATVRGKLADLAALLEGRLDGDALFFSRRLAVEGNTEAVVALRNVMESEQVNLSEMLLRRVAPFDPPLRIAIGPVRWAYGMAEHALAAIERAMSDSAIGRRPRVELRDTGDRHA